MAKWLLIILNVFCGIYSIYFIGVLLLGIFRKKKPAYPEAEPVKRIAAVIAARNESEVIGECVRTLINQNYPRALFDVWVIPNNCTDDTERVAREAGAHILNCPDGSVKSKGEALKLAFNALVEDYDGFCIFDADNLVNADFLRAVNNALCADVRIAQGYRDSKNAPESWVAGGMSMFYWFMSSIYNRGRAALGMSVMLNGTGLMISSGLLKETGWNSRTLTEDLEYSALCGAQGVKIGWMENAVVFDEQPNRFVDSLIQRQRWYAGSVQCLFRYGGSLWKRSLTKWSLQATDFAIFYLGNLVQLAGIVTGAAALVKAAKHLLEWGGIQLLCLVVVALALGFIILCTIGAVLICMIAKKPLRENFPGIFGFWMIAVSWLPANLSSLFLPRKWKAIPHKSQKHLSDVEPVYLKAVNTEANEKREKTVSQA